MQDMVRGLAMVAMAVAATACGDKLPGTYAGSLDFSQSASVTLGAVTNGSAEVKRFSGGKSTEGATVVVRAKGEGYRVEMPGCPFDSVRDSDQGAMTVAPDQSCTLDLEGHAVKFVLIGIGQLAADDSLSLTIDGSAATPKAAGGVSWNYTGKKR